MAAEGVVRGSQLPIVERLQMNHPESSPSLPRLQVRPRRIVICFLFDLRHQTKRGFPLSVDKAATINSELL